MKHVIQSDPEIGVVMLDACTTQTESGPETETGLETLLVSIDQRANYVGPVLENLLHLDHDEWPWRVSEHI